MDKEDIKQKLSILLHRTQQIKWLDFDEMYNINKEVRGIIQENNFMLNYSSAFVIRMEGCQEYKYSKNSQKEKVFEMYFRETKADLKSMSHFL